MKKEREERDEVDEVNKEAATVTALDKEDEWESELNDYQHLQNRVTGIMVLFILLSYSRLSVLFYLLKSIWCSNLVLY